MVENAIFWFNLWYRYPADLFTRAKIESILDWHHSNLRRGAATLVMHTALAPFLGLTTSHEAVKQAEKLVMQSLGVIESVWLKGDAKFLLGSPQPSIADLSLVCEIMQLEVCMLTACCCYPDPAMMSPCMFADLWRWGPWPIPGSSWEDPCLDGQGEESHEPSFWGSPRAPFPSEEGMHGARQQQQGFWAEHKAQNSIKALTTKGRISDRQTDRSILWYNIINGNYY